MGYLSHLTEKNIAKFYKVKSELPSLSRTLYETLLTGVSPFEHGVVNNSINRMSQKESVFHLAKKNNLITAAAAYNWVSELYVESPFNAEKHRIQNDETAIINHGIYYWQEDYPDSHLFMDAEYLIHTFNPDFLMRHPMNVDLAVIPRLIESLL